MFVRGYLAEVKEQRRQLSLLWSNCQGLAEHAGQAAFQTGIVFMHYLLLFYGQEAIIGNL